MSAKKQPKKTVQNKPHSLSSRTRATVKLLTAKLYPARAYQSNSTASHTTPRFQANQRMCCVVPGVVYLEDCYIVPFAWIFRALGLSECTVERTTPTPYTAFVLRSPSYHSSETLVAENACLHFPGTCVVPFEVLSGKKPSNACNFAGTTVVCIFARYQVSPSGSISRHHLWSQTRIGRTRIFN